MRRLNERSVFKELVRELLEADAKGLDEPMFDDSLDRQVDKFLMQYEEGAQRKKNESYDYRDHTRRMLSEADDVGGDDGNELDVEDYAASTMRLMTNYDSLLDIRDTIMRRAYNYIFKNYDSTMAKEYLDVMRRDYDVELNKTRHDKEAEIKAPPAERAGGPGGA